MIRAENLIVEGRYFISSEIESKYIDNLKKILVEFMNRKNYDPADRRTIFLPDRFLTMTFDVRLPFENDFSTGLRVKKALGLISETEMQWQRYRDSLIRTRDDIPKRVTFSIIPSKLQDKEGFVISIRSEPTILFKMRNLQMRPSLDEFDYSDVIESNKQFICNTMQGVGATVLDEPSAIAEYSGTLTLEKLEKFGFHKIVKMLKQGRIKIERGDTEDGLTDLREGLQRFVSEALRRVGGKPKNKIGADLDALRELGYIDKWAYDLVDYFLCKWIYSYLSARPVHGRERINFDDARFLFSISEELVSYLLEKILLGR